MHGPEWYFILLETKVALYLCPGSPVGEQKQLLTFYQVTLNELYRWTLQREERAKQIHPELCAQLAWLIKRTTGAV